MSGTGAVAPPPPCTPLESRATLMALDSVRPDFDTWAVDKGKPVERRGRKATGLRDGSYDGGAASIARRRERSHSPSAFRAESTRQWSMDVSGENYDTNGKSRLRRDGRGTSGGPCRRGGIVRPQFVLIDDADGAAADRYARA